ncbi:MAG: hypothetical protein ACTSPB_03475 [Candidatus Thorarchaeota archaeon]
MKFRCENCEKICEIDVNGDVPPSICPYDEETPRWERIYMTIDESILLRRVRELAETTKELQQAEFIINMILLSFLELSVACPKCGSFDYETLHEFEGLEVTYHIRGCKKCGMVWYYVG